MAFVRSPLKTGSGPAPTPVTIPKFVIEYEKTDPTVTECSFTVINEGLYFLAQVGCSATAGGLYINSTEGQIWYTKSGSVSTSGIVCAFATLYPGDTVRYLADGGYTNLGLVRHAIRILNAQFDSVTSIDMQFNQATSNYDILNIDEPSFIYFGGSYNGSSASDSSSINGSVCDTYVKIADDRTSVSRVVTCCDADDGGTISASGATYCRTLFLIAKLVNVSPAPTPVMGALTATENGNYIPSDYDYDGFNSVNVNVAPTPTAYESGVLSIADNPLTLSSFDTSSDNHIIVDYEVPSGDGGMSVCGAGNGSNSLMHLTTWSGNRLYAGTGSGEYIIGTGTSYTKGRHTFEFNRNGYIYFDNVQSNAITPSNDAITIGSRSGATYKLYGIIYSVEIKSNSTGNTLLKLVPDEQNGEVGFTDEISSTFYPYGHKLVYSEIDT